MSTDTATPTVPASQASVELDWAEPYGVEPNRDRDETPAETALRDAGEVANQRGLAVAMVTDRGPAGGHPVMRFSGARDRLRALILDHSDGDHDLVRELLPE